MIRVASLVCALLAAVYASALAQTQGMPEVLIFINVLDFHSDPACTAVKPGTQSRPITLKDAVERGLRACPICHPEDGAAIKQFIARGGANAAVLVQGGPPALAAISATERAATNAKLTAPFVRPTLVQLRKFAADAAAKADGDKDKFNEAFEKQVKAINEDYEGGEYDLINILDSRDKTYMMLRSPVHTFQLSAAERVRKMQPLTAIPLSNVIAIDIDPDQIDSPDVERVVVRRNGVIIPPIANTLTLKTFTTRLGAKTMLHEGTVTYPLSAFAPGPNVSVSVIGITRSGDNLRKDFDGQALRKIY